MSVVSLENFLWNPSSALHSWRLGTLKLKYILSWSSATQFHYLNSGPFLVGIGCSLVLDARNPQGLQVQLCNPIIMDNSLTRIYVCILSFIPKSNQNNGKYWYLGPKFGEQFLLLIELQLYWLMMQQNQNDPFYKHCHPRFFAPNLKTLSAGSSWILRRKTVKRDVLYNYLIAEHRQI